jgi:hypothetical protein
MKNKIYHTLETVPKFNGKIGTGTSIKSGGLK